MSKYSDTFFNEGGRQGNSPLFSISLIHSYHQTDFRADNNQHKTTWGGEWGQKLLIIILLTWSQQLLLSKETGLVIVFL